MINFNFKKKYGQNFLIDDNIIRNIVLKSDIKDNSLIMEIGCGDGRLTKELCKTNNMVIGYEIDEEAVVLLKNNMKDYSNFALVGNDFLKADLLKDISNYKFSNLYIVANLPYYITTLIIEKIIDELVDVVSGITIMVQKEVGDRICAKAGSREYGSLSVYLDYYFDIKKLFYVSKKCFVPTPKVDSVVINMKKHLLTKKVNNEELFFKLVRDSFKFKRKNIKNNLIDYDLDTILKVLNKYGYDLNVRAEQLSLDIFIDIANSLSI